MKFSCLPCSLFGEVIDGRMSVADWSRLAKELGLDGFDITILFVRDRTPAGLAKMRRELEAGGLPVLMMSIYPDLTDLRPGVFEKELIRAKSDIAVASDLGVKIVRITAGQFHPESDPEKQLSQSIRGILDAK